jgi:hypothetical protein
MVRTFSWKYLPGLMIRRMQAPRFNLIEFRLQPLVDRIASARFGSIAVPAVEGWQLLYFGGAKNNVGLFLFWESRFMDQVIAPVASAVSQKVPFC